MYRAKIGHVLLNVHDLDRAIDFYTRFLNLRLVERVEDHHAFLSGGDSHHEIALQKVGPDAPHPSPGGAGLDHIAFQVPDKRSLARAFKTLTAAGLHVRTVDNVISWSLYLDDPEGNGIEIYLDARNEPHGQPMWRGIRKPLEPEKILAALTEDDRQNQAIS